MEALVNIAVAANFDHFDLGEPVVLDAIQRPQPGVVNLRSVAYKKNYPHGSKERRVEGCHPEGEHVWCMFQCQGPRF
jgi:hypothetical protein